jgi:uncharacterized protein YlxW (UPF0749 family)
VEHGSHRRSDEQTDGGNHLGGPLVAGVILLLCALLGFGIATQVRRTAAGDSLAAMRPDDLVQILDGLQQREDDLNSEVVALQSTLARLRVGGASSGQALAEAQRQAEQLGILAGTVAAHGPGIRITIADPAKSVEPEVLLDAVQELRNAGAEAQQIDGIRIGMDSAFTGDRSQILLDGTPVTRPILIVAIGDPPTLAAAMAIPGGVVDSVKRTGARIEVTQSNTVVVDALRPVRTPQYARPTG